MKKEITVFSCGDSTDVKTWSNVPFLFTQSLIARGFVINRVDVSPNRTLSRWFDRRSYFVFKRILKLDACPEYHRTFIHRILSRKKIKKATKLYPNTQLNLFLTYAYYNKYSNKPSVNWCDWTDEIVIQRIGRNIKWYELSSIKHERTVMSRSNLVFSLFPMCSKQMSAMYNRDVIWLDRNVVNTTFESNPKIDEIIERRVSSNIILFIGGLKYIGSAKDLIEKYI